MNIENISKEYYYHKNGEIIEDVNLIRGDCLPLNTYIILKNKYDHLDKIYRMLIDDINFVIVLENNMKIKNISYQNSSIKKEGILKYQSYEFIYQGLDAINALEKFVDNEKLVMIQTINEWLPFSIHFDPYYKFNSFNPGHIQIVIGYDEKQLYFVEDPALINYEMFDAYSNDVGKLDRTTAIEVMGTYLKCITVNINMKRYREIDSIIYNIIKKSCIMYRKEKEQDMNGNTYHYGREAINSLIDISKKEYIYLDENDKNLGPINLFLRWKFRAIKNKRYTLFLFFKYFQDRYHQIGISELIKKDYDEWNKIWIIFERKFKKKEYLWDKSLAKYFENILQLEDKLFDNIEKLSF